MNELCDLVLSKNSFSDLAADIGVNLVHLAAAEKFLRRVGAVLGAPRSDTGGDLALSHSLIAHLVTDVSQDLGTWVSARRFNRSDHSIILQTESAVLTGDELQQFLLDHQYPASIHSLLLSFLQGADVLVPMDPQDGAVYYFAPSVLPVSPLSLLLLVPTFGGSLKNLTKGKGGEGADVDWYARYPEHISMLLSMFGSQEWARVVGGGGALMFAELGIGSFNSNSKNEKAAKEVGRFYQFEYLSLGSFSRIMSKFIGVTEVHALAHWQTGTVFARGRSIVFLGLNVKLHQIVLHIKGHDAGMISVFLFFLLSFFFSPVHSVPTHPFRDNVISSRRSHHTAVSPRRTPRQHTNPRPMRSLYGQILLSAAVFIYTPRMSDRPRHRHARRVLPAVHACHSRAGGGHRPRPHTLYSDG